VARVSQPVKRTTTQEVEGHDERHEAYGFGTVSFRDENLVPGILELHTCKHTNIHTCIHAYMHAGFKHIYVHTQSDDFRNQLDDLGAPAHIKTI